MVGPVRETWRTVLEEEEAVGREGREELMPTAQQWPPPPLRACRSTGKEQGSRGPLGVQVQGDCQGLPHPLSSYSNICNNNRRPHICM